MKEETSAIISYFGVDAEIYHFAIPRLHESNITQT